MQGGPGSRYFHYFETVGNLNHLELDAVNKTVVFNHINRSATFQYVLKGKYMYIAAKIASSGSAYNTRNAFIVG